MARRYTEEQFRSAIDDPAVRTVADLCRALGIVPRGGNYETVRRYAAELDIHLDARFRRNGGRVPQPPRPLPSEHELRMLVAHSRSFAGIIRGLGWPLTASSYRRLRTEIERLEISVGHLLGQGWANGTSRPERRKPLATYLVRGSRISGGQLRERLIAEGVMPRRCQSCRGEVWLDQPIPLELDHINGDRNDNRLENLRFLCPNCHALTPTYRGRNIGRYATSAAAPEQPDLLSSEEPG